MTRGAVARWGAVAALAVAMGCAPGRDHAGERQVVRATLVELFATRERARAITVWHDPRRQAPTLSAFGGPFDHTDTLALQVVDTTGLALPFRVQATTLRDSDAFFRAHASGWDAWFEANPGNAGIVEVAKPHLFTDSAVVIVGRACGEQCRNAWRVSLQRASPPRETDGWRVRVVTPLQVPR